MTCSFHIYTTALNTYEVHNVQSEMWGKALARRAHMLPQIYEHPCLPHSLLDVCEDCHGARTVGR